MLLRPSNYRFTGLGKTVGNISHLPSRIELIIEFFSVYWPGLSAMLIPLKGVCRITLLTILGRIHTDIVRLWNFKVWRLIMMFLPLFDQPMNAQDLEEVGALPNVLATMLKFIFFVNSGHRFCLELT